ncbi:MAG: hypothetical protein IKB86_03460 [Clostridia bacterium]|nr:hypothetical protein [Clostridia bacterium]
MENNSQLERAYKEWQQAINVFNNATEKDDIDYAIYNLETKKRQYMRLVNLAKESSYPKPREHLNESNFADNKNSIKRKSGLIFQLVDALKGWLDKFYVYEEDDFE